jgi:hypothetical protein
MEACKRDHLYARRGKHASYARRERCSRREEFEAGPSNGARRKGIMRLERRVRVESEQLYAKREVCEARAVACTRGEQGREEMRGERSMRGEEVREVRKSVRQPLRLRLEAPSPAQSCGLVTGCGDSLVMGCFDPAALLCLLGSSSAVLPCLHAGVRRFLSMRCVPSQLVVGAELASSPFRVISSPSCGHALNLVDAMRRLHDWLGLLSLLLPSCAASLCLPASVRSLVLILRLREVLSSFVSCR